MNTYSGPKGQILPGSKFGDMLTKLASSSESIVEVGTWHGEGSTLCLHRGMTRPTQRLWSFDIDSTVVANARTLYASDQRVQIIHGAISIGPGQDSTLQFDIGLLPVSIDLYLIDGGDDNGSDDLDRLLSRCRVIALDDTERTKNKLNHARLLSLGWTVIKHEPTDRNGWSILHCP